MLCVVIAHKVFQRNGQPNPVHVFDAGLAFENLALQGAARGLVVHGMAGFDFERARTALGVRDDYAVCAMFAAGQPGDPNELPPALREIEKPSQRKPVSEIICAGRFAFSNRYNAAPIQEPCPGNGRTEFRSCSALRAASSASRFSPSWRKALSSWV